MGNSPNHLGHGSWGQLCAWWRQKYRFGYTWIDFVNLTKSYSIHILFNCDILNLYVADNDVKFYYSICQ